MMTPVIPGECYNCQTWCCHDFPPPLWARKRGTTKMAWTRIRCTHGEQLLTVKAHLYWSYTFRQLHRAKPLDALRGTRMVATGLKLPQPRSDPGFKKSQR